MDRLSTASTQRPATVPVVTEEEKHELFKTLPRNVIIPVDPIQLTPEQEMTACKLTCRDLDHFDPRELRDVYIECSQHDKHLDGFCTIEVLDNSLRKHRAYLSNALRIIAAQFLDRHQPGKVNYERIVSFIGTALDMQKKGQLGEERPRYYMQNDEAIKTGSIFKDREVAKLLRMVEHELSKSTYSMDWTKWQNLFYEMDRDHRETLSGPQIKSICHECNLPLTDSLTDKILGLCEYNNRDGQYRWPAFLDFLSRVRPSNTGLPIPVSKRPLEYAKHYPKPVPNWPKSDEDEVQRKEQSSPHTDRSPRRGEYYKEEHKENPYDERGKSPQRAISPSQDQKEKKEKVDLSDRRTYSPYKYANSRDPPADQYRSGSPRVGQYHWSPSPVRDQSFAPAEPRSYGDGYPAYRHDDPSGGYKPSWQGNDPQRQSSSPNRKDTHTKHKDRQEVHVSPNRNSMPRETWDTRYEQDPYNRGIYNTEGDVRHRIPDPYVRSLRVWEEPGRGNDNRYQAQRRSNRPNSYAEPQRGALQELQYDQSYGRLRTPVNRARSLSPVHYVSPAPVQQYTNTYREYTSPYREQSYAYGQDQNLYREHNDQQHVYPAVQRGTQQLHQKNYRLKAPYADTYNIEGRYPETHRDNPQFYQGYYRRPRQQQPLYANIYGDGHTYQDPSRDRFPYGFQEADNTRYHQQQYPPQQQFSHDRYRRRDDDREGHRQDREAKIHQLSTELEQIDTNVRRTREHIHDNERPWLERYLKLAEALYNRDRHNSGYLPRADVIDLVRQYNDAFHLELNVDRADRLTKSPENTDKSGHVVLKHFLAHLCGDNFKNRI